MLPADFMTFLLRAKQNTYASGRSPDRSSRPASHDLTYVEDPYLYIDTYLGGYAFIGEEAVWHAGVPIWGMNYYGKMLTSEIPDGFSAFLKNALLRVTPEMPYRGPALYTEGSFLFQCAVSGDLSRFKGEEVIFHDSTPIYRLDFHGGEVIQ